MFSYIKHWRILIYQALKSVPGQTNSFSSCCPHCRSSSSLYSYGQSKCNEPATRYHYFSNLTIRKYEGRRKVPKHHMCVYLSFERNCRLFKSITSSWHVSWQTGMIFVFKFWKKTRKGKNDFWCRTPSTSCSAANQL